MLSLMEGSRRRRQQCLMTRQRHIMKSGSLQSSFLFLITEETRESLKKWSIAILQPGSLSPASGRPCPPSLGRAGPRWWPPHGSHLCPQRKRRSPVFHSTSGSPGKQKTEKFLLVPTDEKTSTRAFQLKAEQLLAFQMEQVRTEGRYLDGLALVHFNDMEVKAVDSFPWGQKHRFKREVVSDVHENLRERHRRRNESVTEMFEQAAGGSERLWHQNREMWNQQRTQE